MAQTTDARKAEADKLFQQGIDQYQKSQIAAAIQSWQQALTIYRSVKDRQREGVALANLGIAYHALGENRKAIEYYEQSLTLARSLGDTRGELIALSSLGSVYADLAEHNKAIEYYAQSLAVATKIGDRSKLEAALANLGVAYQALGNYQKAIDYYQQNLAIAREIHDRRGEGVALGNLGIVRKAKGDYVTAIDYYQQTLAIMREIGDRKWEGKALGNLGNAYEALGEYDKAIESYKQSLAIAQSIKDVRGEGVVLGNLGGAYANLGETAKAIELYEQSLTIAREIGDREGQGHTLNNLGSAYHSQRDRAQAIENYQQALAIAKEIGNRQIEAASWSNLGIAYKDLGDLPRAIESQKQSLALAKNIGDVRGEGEALHNLGLVLFKAGKRREAETALRNAIKIRESLRPELNDIQKVSIIDTQLLTYELLQKVLVAQNKPEAGLEIAERGRARAFVELLARRLSNNLEAQTQINAPTTEQIQQIAKVQNATFVEYSILFEESPFQGKQRGEASELFIWVIQPGGKVAFRRVELKSLRQKNTSLQNLVTSSRDSIGVRGISVVGGVKRPGEMSTESLQHLHKLLIEPIADLLPADPDSRVIFVPQNELFLVPFAALVDDKGKYLIEKHTILTSPAIQVLQLTHQQQQNVSGTGVLVVGNPTMPSIPPAIGQPPQQLPSLLGAQAEAEAIAALFGTKAITGNQATKASVMQKMPKAKIIHLATHGLLDDFSGLGVPGAIALAPDSPSSINPPQPPPTSGGTAAAKGINGLLTASEIMDMKLNAELVVLSACDTGRGTITGDGVVGLSRSLISAGVPSVIVSLWSVPDAPTAFLMTQFYKNFQQTSDKAKSLRQAMLATKKQHPDPKNWAAFTLIGEAG